jgi:GT2 family glycosyltransferase
LRSQEHRLAEIIVVDNGSTDGTASWVRQQKDLTLITQGNLGSAGGQNTGIRTAYGHGHEWVWCMDDDGFPDRMALVILLEDDSCGALWRNCLVVDIENRSKLAFSQKTVDEVQKEGPYSHWVDPFNGTLIHRRALEIIGYPAVDLFIKGDEIEYANRAEKLGIGVLTNTRAIFYHPASSTRDVTEVALKGFWRHYYHIRNKHAEICADGRLRLNAKAALTFGLRDARRLVRHAVVAPAGDMVKVWMIFRAVYAAWRGDLTKRYVKP